MNNKMILPFVEKPYFTVYQLRGYELGVIQAHYPEIRPWIYNKNINIQYMNKANRCTFVTYDRWHAAEGILECQRMRMLKEPLSNSSLNWFEMMKKMMSLGYYVYLMINERYVPHKSRYKISEFDHDMFLYGYDDDNECLYAAGYTANERYETFTLSYAQCIEAVDLLSRNNPHFDFVRPSGKFENKLNIQEICDDLYDYIHSINSRANVKNEYKVFGIDCKSVYIDVIKGMSSIDKNIDMRFSRLFMEIEALMCERIGYLVDNGIIKDNGYTEKCAAALRESEKIHMQCVKYNVLRNEKLLDRIAGYQREVIAIEKELYPALLSDLYLYKKNKNNFPGTENGGKI